MEKENLSKWDIRDEYGMTREDYEKQYNNNLKKIAMPFLIIGGLKLLEKI